MPPVAFLKFFFLAFVGYVTTQILFGLKPGRTRPMPGPAGLFGVGALIGGLSGLAGVGGAMVSVPFMTTWGVPFTVGDRHLGRDQLRGGRRGHHRLRGGGPHRARASRVDRGLRLPAGVPGHLGDERVRGPLGAKAAHRLPVDDLKKVFAVFLLALAVKLSLAL